MKAKFLHAPDDEKIVDFLGQIFNNETMIIINFIRKCIGYPLAWIGIVFFIGSFMFLGNGNEKFGSWFYRNFD